MKRLGQTLLYAMMYFIIETILLVPQFLASGSGSSLLCILPIAFLISIALGGVTQRQVANWALMRRAVRVDENSQVSLAPGNAGRYALLDDAVRPYQFVRLETVPAPLVEAVLANIPLDESIEAATCGPDKMESGYTYLIAVTRWRLVIGRIHNSLSIMSALTGVKPNIVSMPIGRVTSVEYKHGKIKTSIVIRAANLDDVVIESVLGHQDRAEAFVQMLSTRIARGAA